MFDFQHKEYFLKKFVYFNQAVQSIYQEMPLPQKY
jgi:hypothetical protein